MSEPLSQVSFPTGNYEVEVLTGKSALIENLKNDWILLCNEGPCEEAFFRPEWVLAYVNAFAPQAQLLILTVRKNGRLRGVLPLIKEQCLMGGLVVNKLRSASNVHSCRFDLIHGQDDSENVSLITWQHLHAMNDWDVIVVEDVREGAAFESILNFAAKDKYLVGKWPSLKTPIIMLPSEVGQLDSALNPEHVSFRSRLKKKVRKIETRGALEYREVSVDDPKEREAFFEIEGSGWKREQGTAIICTSDTLSFYREVAEKFGALGMLRLGCLFSGPDRVAMSFALVSGSTFLFPKIGYNDSFAEFSPGHLFTEHLLKHLVRNQIRRFDFVGPTADWKEKWAHQFNSHAHCYIYNPRLSGKLLHFMRFGVLSRVRTLKHKWEGRV